MISNSRSLQAKWSTAADNLLPGLGQVRRYERAWLRADLTAGLTVASHSRQSPAYGPRFLPLAVYALLGSSRQLSIGPESSTTVMTAAALEPVAAGDAGRYAVSAAALALLVG